ncbi:MAG: sigma-54-dependent Fis family transcriptional regulator [Desulfobacteraceae bacterium]|nr:MAG: sigma-54-dependent Fis family transcriptional regulator [Desulfobacteraceae bacterium]
MKPARILVIDDEPAICDGCRLVLSEKSHEVDICSTGREGMEAIRSNGYELILLDLKLPDADGMDLLKRLSEEGLRIAVIVMTGYSSVQNAVAAMKLGASDYLAKPFSDDQLVMAVEKALAAKRLTEENLALRKQLYAMFDFSNIVGENQKLLQVFEEVRRAAPTDSTILLRGESGTGKELFAKAIHAHSRRAARQFIVVDCSTFSSSLLESELFGHVKGAFTGAIQDKAGIFEVADGGTLFLDEIGNLSVEVQAKLLRVMETHEFKPVGSNRTQKTDMRIIAATHRDLEAMVEQGRFREDLFYRINVLPITIPPLRKRRDDIPKLAYHFLRRFCGEMGRRIQGFSDEALQLLINYDWPGNVRQLKNVVERLVIMADEKILDRFQIASNLHPPQTEGLETIPRSSEDLKKIKRLILRQSYEPIEKAFLRTALEAAGGNISRAAEKVGMQRSNFSALMKKHGLGARKKSSAA